MPAPKKNQFWKARSKHGRDKIFETPKILSEASNEYFQWCLDNPLYEMIIQGGKEFTVPKMRAMTESGLFIFLDIERQTFDNYCDKENESYKGFFAITTRIKEVIRTQKFEGAAAGLLNANIIARDLGLKDKSETEHKGQIKTDLSQLTTEELIKRAEAINKLEENENK